MTLADLDRAVTERANSRQDCVFEGVLERLHREHISGGELGCLCSYCSQLKDYIQAKKLFKKAVRSNSVFDSESNVGWCEHCRNRFEIARIEHKRLKMLDG